MLRRDLLLRWLNGLLGLVLRRVGARAGDLMAQRGGQLLAVMGKELRIVRSVRDSNIGHAVVEQIFRASSVSTCTSTRSAVCPWLEWLVKS